MCISLLIFLSLVVSFFLLLLLLLFSPLLLSLSLLSLAVSFSLSLSLSLSLFPFYDDASVFLSFFVTVTGTIINKDWSDLYLVVYSFVLA